MSTVERCDWPPGKINQGFKLKWITWLKEGDLNTHFFHKSANDRRNHNAIWRIKRLDDSFAHSTPEIQKEAFSYFSTFYMKDQSISIENQTWVLDHTKIYFDVEAIALINKCITRKEVLGVLKSFPHDKCPGPDGWPAEFFIHFFDLLGGELTDLMEVFRTQGHIPANLNSTFIALIPKISDPQSFSDFRPISLCNLIYKVTSKIIANRIKGCLSRHISKKQYGFLEG